MKRPGEVHRPQDRPAPRILPMLDDIDMTGLADGDTLTWNAATSKWKPGSASGPDVIGFHNEFTLPGSPSTTYTLSYVPKNGTCLMSLNGHVQREGTDYTCDYSTGIVTVTATLTAGDLLTFRYLLTAPNVSGAAAANGKAIRHDDATSVTSAVMNLDAATATNDIVVLAAVVGTTSITSISGLGAAWTKLDAQTFVSTNYELWIGTRCTSGNTAITITTAATGVVSAQAQAYSNVPVKLATTLTFTNGFTSPYVLAGQTSTASGQIVVTIGICGADVGITFTDHPSAWTSTYYLTETGGSVRSLYLNYIVTTAAGTTYSEDMSHANNDRGVAWALLLGS